MKKDCCNRNSKKENHAPGCRRKKMPKKVEAVAASLILALNANRRNPAAEEKLIDKIMAEHTAMSSAREDVLSWAQATLTALNVGDVKSESLLHLKLREVLIAYRDAADTAKPSPEGSK